MPLLGRLFAKKNKIPPPPRAEILDDNPNRSPTLAPTTESNDSSTSSYVTPDISVPSHPNAQDFLGREQGHSTLAPSGGGGGLRLFRRKKSTTPSSGFTTSSTSDVTRSEFASPQRSVFPRHPDAATDLTDLRRLRPPPSRSAIFAAYADSGSSISTRSLPENPFRPSSPLLSPSPSPAPSQKRSLFAWAKPASRSSSNTGSNVDVSLRTPSESSELPANSHSFNLKSFRHIGAASPPLPIQRPDSLSPPIPLPRGTGFHSDSSQRISVAAFREVQARRSQTSSPVPSPNESIPTLPASKSEGPRPGHGPRPSRSSAALLQTSRQGRSSLAIASSTDEDNSSSEADSEAEVHKGKSHQRPGRKAQSELGHGSMVKESSFKRANVLVRTPRASRSHVGHGSPRPLTETEKELKRPELGRRPQSTPGLYEGPNKVVTPSTTSVNKSVPGHERNSSISSNVTHSAARKLTPPPTVSNQQATKAKATVDPPPRNSDSDSEDNAPLASLIAPKRPGSAMSSYSNPRSISGQTNRSAGHAKPLIDVNEVISSRPTTVGSPSPSDAAFTQGSTLLSAVKTTAVVRGSSPLASPNPKLADDDRQPSGRMVPPLKFVSTPSSPAKETTESVSNLNERMDLEERSEMSPFPQQRESSPEQQTRDPLSDRLSRAVKKSLTNPINSGSMPAPIISKPLEGTTNRLSVATSSESLQTRQSYEPARISLPRSPPPIIQPSKDEYSPPDEDLAKLLGSVGIKLISRTGESDETSSSENSEEDEEEKQQDEDRIAPIPIKQRAPPPAFAVTSRPAFPKLQEQSSQSNPSEVKNLSEQTERKTPATARPSDYPSVRQRSSSMLPSLSSNSFPSSNASPSTRDSKVTSYFTSPSATDVSSKSTSSHGQALPIDKTTVRPVVGVKQKSNTMVTGVSSQIPRQFKAPDRRFATVRENSPSSSTGDSSSGRTPHTPRDSGEMCVPEDREHKRMSSATKTEEWSRGTSGLGIKRQNAHAKRRSVSFEDDVRGLNAQPSRSHIREAATAGSDAIRSGGGHVRESARAGPDRELSDEEGREKKEEKEKEAKRKERRRQEAQAAIELGNVMHGPPPVLDDDNNDMPTNPSMNRRLSAFNPMMVMNPMTMPMTYATPPGPGGWVPSMALSPAQFMIPQPSNPNMMAAHQQAMMVAKQAYQMAVAQHAMAAAGEEWERGSALGGFGSAGSVYGSPAPSMINAQPGMMGGMGMMPGMQGNAAGGMWPSPLYGGMGAVPRFGHYLSPSDVQFSSTRSDHGALGASSRTSVNWGSSKSMYGESFGQSNESFSRKVALQQQSVRQQTWSTGRDSMHLPLVPPIPGSKNMTGPEPKGPSRLRTSSQPAIPNRSAFARKAIPPSSWRPSGS